jgi:hypothetical protein
MFLSSLLTYAYHSDISPAADKREFNMARKKVKTVQVFIVSWFPPSAREAATIQCISRDSAKRIVAELKQSFTAYPGHDPLIHVDRTEVPET